VQHHGGFDAWDGQGHFAQSFKGDVVRLLLDCGDGTLTVKKNGVWLGVAIPGLTGEFCWAAFMVDESTCKAQVRIVAADPATF
jgi:hypothetical protein